MNWLRCNLVRFLGCIIAAYLALPGTANAQERTLTVWTMGGDQPGWVKWLDTISADFEKRNPGAKVKITYYDKNALQVALNARYMHRHVHFFPTLSPVHVLPSEHQLDRAMRWGRTTMARELPLVRKFFEPVRWVEPASQFQSA